MLAAEPVWLDGEVVSAYRLLLPEGLADVAPGVYVRLVVVDAPG
ncbi:MAG: hypothetical protein WBY53_06965 [Acidobacteriaceae bacterium]